MEKRTYLEHPHGTRGDPPRWARPILARINDLSPLVGDCVTLLDLGCGRRGPPILKGARFLVGVDRFDPALADAKRNRTHDDFVKADIRHLPFKGKSVDGVVALDVIEHLTELDGQAFVDAVERIARKRVIIMTPNGFSPKEELEDQNPWQAHRSGWNADDFRRRGYSVEGRRGLKVLRASHAAIRWHPQALWGVLAYVSQLFVRTRPEHAFHLLAYRVLPDSGSKPPRVK